MTNPHLSRRRFVTTSGGAAAAMVATHSLVRTSTWARQRGANEDIRVAILGVGGKGSAHIGDFRDLDGVRIVAVADADQDHVDRARAQFTGEQEKIDGYQDYRKVLDRDDVDAVVIATPNHWHTPMAVHACQSGKDVYVEKPVTHNIWEGQRLVEAAAKYECIVQSGMQRRSDPGWLEAIDFLRSGQLGKLLVSRGLCYKRRKTIGKVNGPMEVPASIDYNLWSGPAQLEPVRRERFHYDWHWQWAYGNGDLGNQGVHQTDVARWALGSMSLPRRAISVGGRFGYDDDGETPNTQFCVLDYPEGLLIFEVQGLGIRAGMEASPAYRGVRVGNVVECEGGYLAEAAAYDGEGQRIRKFELDGGGSHQANFIKAVRSRKQEDIAVNALDGHLSAAICHVANISHRVGRFARPEEVAEKLKENAAAEETFERFKEHLAANHVDLNDFRPTLGGVVEMDVEKETFTGPNAEAANQFLSRQYREPFDIAEV